MSGICLKALPPGDLAPHADTLDRPGEYRREKDIKLHLIHAMGHDEGSEGSLFEILVFSVVGAWEEVVKSTGCV